MFSHVYTSGRRRNREAQKPALIVNSEKAKNATTTTTPTQQKDAAMMATLAEEEIYGEDLLPTPLKKLLTTTPVSPDDDTCQADSEDVEIVNAGVDYSFNPADQQSVASSGRRFRKVIGRGDDNRSLELAELYAETAFHFFKLNSPLRRRFIRLHESPWTGRVSICVILINCICLGFMDTCDFNCIAPRCQMLQSIDLFIFAFFFVEMLCKMMAMGVYGARSYLSHPWNMFDFIIIVVGSTEFVYGKGAIGLSAIRTFRVLRPLRAINRIPSLKILVELLLESLPMLGNVLLFAFFIFFVFGICGIQLWAGILRHRCYFPLESPEFMEWVNATNMEHFLSEMPPFYSRPGTGDFVCTNQFGMLKCEDIPLYESEGSICDLIFHDDEAESCKILVLNYTDCRPNAPNPSRQTVSFDNIGSAWIAIFQVINLESWTEVMYYVQDAYSFWVWIYFVILIVIGSFFALNLCLVVIANHFQEAKSRNSSKFAGLSGGGSLDLGGSIYIQTLDLIVLALRHIYQFLATQWRRYRQRHATQVTPPSDNRSTGGGDAATTEHLDLVLSVGTYNITLTAAPAAQTTPAKQQKQSFKDNKYYKIVVAELDDLRVFLRATFEHNSVSAIIMLVIVLNTLIMGSEHHEQPETLTLMIENLNVAFTCFFAVELCLKIFAYGLCNYIRDGFNMLDLVVVLVNLFELIQGTGSGFFVLRAFRLVRLVKIIRFLPGLQRQLLVMMRTVDNVASFFMLVSLFLFIFAIMGMSLFGCQYCPALNKYMRPEYKGAEKYHEKIILNDTLIFALDDNATVIEDNEHEEKDHSHEIELISYFICPRTNFDTLPSSLFTVLQVFTQDSWTAVLKDGMTVTSDWAGLYFVALVSIGNYVLLNLLVAILVEGFSSSETADNSCLDSSSAPSLYEAFAMRRQRTAPLASIESLNDSELDDVAIKASPLSLGFVVNAAKPANSAATEASPMSWRSSIRNISWNFCCGLGRQIDKRRNYSFFLLSPRNRLRRLLNVIVSSRYFDNIVLFFIFFNCIVITMERPAIKKDSMERKGIDYANSTINLLFLVEAILKIVAKGFFLGPGSYLRDNWNILDFILVNCSSAYTLFDVFFSRVEEAKILEILRVLRLLRALRPLRVVNRAPGLKIVVETLLLSVKPIGNIIVITSAFFLIFAILGVQMFRGCFYRCVVASTKYISNRQKSAVHHGAHQASEAEMLTFEALMNVHNRTDCEGLGSTFEWENESYNFDNLLQALMTLFVFATFDGWVEITRAGIDCVGVDSQPRHDHNPWKILYFISFLLIVCFFVVNMFVGVVVTNFEKVHKRVLAEKEAQRRRAKRMAMFPKKKPPPSKLKRMFMLCMGNSESSTVRRYSLANDAPVGGVNKLTGVSNQPIAQQPTPASHRQRRHGIVVSQSQAASIRNTVRRQYMLHKYLQCRLRMHRIFTHKYFELVLVGITTFNVLIMAVEYYQMPRELLLAIKGISYAFTILLAIEILMKMIATGVRRCLRDKWTRLDLFILAASAIEMLFEDSYSRVMPINPTIFRLLRLVRIARVFRLLKTAKGVRRLLDTVSEALPKVAHLSLVFFLLFFIYASLGVELFGKFSCPYAKCGGLSRHASFEHFGMAMLTLFRIFTGDKWNGILKDMLHASSDSHYCRKLLDINLYPNGGVECRTAGIAAPFFFVSFVLTSRFVLINVVVAVLMSQLQRSNRDEIEEVMPELQNHVQRSLSARRAPPNSLQNSQEDIGMEMDALFNYDPRRSSEPGQSLRPSQYSPYETQLFRQPSQSQSHFSLSHVVFGRDVSLHLIDESVASGLNEFGQQSSLTPGRNLVASTSRSFYRNRKLSSRRSSSKLSKSRSQHGEMASQQEASDAVASQPPFVFRTSESFNSVPSIDRSVSEFQMKDFLRVELEERTLRASPTSANGHVVVDDIITVQSASNKDKTDGGLIRSETIFL